MNKSIKKILSLVLTACICLSSAVFTSVEASSGAEMIGYRDRNIFEILNSEYPVDYVYYFNGIDVPLSMDGITYLTVSDARATIYDFTHQSKVFSLDKFTVTTTQYMEQLIVYKLNDNYKMDIIFERQNVAAGSTYTFSEKGIYNISCNDYPIGSVEVVSYDHDMVGIREETPQFIMDNPYNYVPVYNGEQYTNLAPGSVIAAPTDSAISVEGNSWKMDAYNINDNNYFKLRDIAFALTQEGTDHPFDVTWDSGKNAINIISDKRYTTVGGECSGSDEIVKASKASVPTTSEIYIDGVQANLQAYHIGGNNYFKLRDLAGALDFEVNWVEEQNMIYVSTSGSYQDENKTDYDYEEENYEDNKVEDVEEKYEPDTDYGTRGEGEYLLAFESSNSGVILGDAGYYKPGEKITIKARSYKDFGFMSWSSDNGGEFYNVFKSETTFTMPANDVVISASYIVDYSNNGSDDSFDSDLLDRYDGQNINLNKYVQLKMRMVGCGSYRDLSGPYHPGQVVELTIGAGDEGIFLGWSSDDVDIPTPNSPSCKIVIPDHDVTVTATFSE